MIHKLRETALISVASYLLLNAPMILACSSYRFDKLTPPVLDPDLDEMSGLVLGKLEPDSLVHIRDSGNDPLLVYTKRDGTILSRYKFAETSTDPEEISRGECPWNSAASCLYVLDTGDNFHWRSQRNIWAVEEMTLRSPVPRSEKIDFRFPHGEAIDLEGATLVGQTFFFFAKEKKHSRVYALDLNSWSDKTAIAEAKLITDLPYTTITGATSSQDGRRILLINWQGVIELSKDDNGEKPVAGDFYPYRKRIKIKGFEQQEGITYDADQRSFLYTSEKRLLFSKQNFGIMKATCVP